MNTIVYLAGDRWDRVAGTDRRLVAALAQRDRVLWVDPPLSVLELRRGRRAVPQRLVEVMPNVTRVRTFAPPLASRPGVRSVIPTLLGSSIRRAVNALAATVSAVVVASPRATFPNGVAGSRVLYVTDDWVAGAGLMGLDATAVAKTLSRNLAAADVVVAVTPYLSEQLASRYGASVTVLANGCDPVTGLPDASARLQRAALVGQLNERLDLDLLEAVRDAGVPILAIGPRTERDPAATERLDRFLNSDGVTWLGEVPYSELPAQLATVKVGLTPYSDSDFNRSSFPLKTLEYLASGLRVVATDLPAVRWLDTDLISVASEPAQFARLAQQAIRAAFDEDEGRHRRDFAVGHSWAARADQLRSLVLASG